MTPRFVRLRLLATLLGTALVPTSTRPAPRPPAPRPRPTVGALPILGVHTRLTDEVEEWKIARTFQMVRAMGAQWAVEYFPWAYIQPHSKQHWEWTHADQVVRHAVANGIRVIARLDGVPAWARPRETTFRYLEPGRFGDFADFVEAFVARYRSAVQHYVIWNEPNTSFEWGYRPVSPEEYTALLRTVYPRIKRAHPQAVVISAGLAPTLEQSEWGLNDLVFLERMYAAGAGAWFDALGVHAYGWRLPPDDPPAPDRVNFARAELHYAIMQQHGDGHKPVFITEAGWNDHPRWTKAVRPAQRIEYTLRAIQKAQAEWPWLRALCFWQFRLPQPARNVSDYATFVDVDFEPKPIYLAVQNLVASLSPHAQPLSRAAREG